MDGLSGLNQVELDEMEAEMASEAEANGCGGYENAPATRMLASQCAACGRPLVDAESVEAGMGPECRKKYGRVNLNSEAARQEANALIYQVALDQSGPTVVGAVAKLRDLGYAALAVRVLDRIGCVRLEELPGDVLAVHTPYSEAVVAALRTIPGRRWDKDAKVNTVPAAQRAALWALLQRFFPGQTAIGPKGAFTIPGGAS